MSNPDNGDNVLVRFHSVGDFETDKAVRLLFSADDAQGQWLPKSQIAHLDTDTGEAWIPLWLAEKKGLEYE